MKKKTKSKNDDIQDCIDSSQNMSIDSNIQQTHTITKDKKLIEQTQIEFLNSMKFVYGSFQLYYKQNKNGEWKKEAVYTKPWKNQRTSFHNEVYNGVYVKTGMISNCFVIDIDDNTKAEASYISIECEKICNLISKTKKGFHYYFEYDSDIHETNTYKEYGFDVRSQGGLIYCAPTFYRDETKKIIRYEFIKKPEDYKLNKITNELKTYIINLIRGYSDRKINVSKQNLAKDINISDNNKTKKPKTKGKIPVNIPKTGIVNEQNVNGEPEKVVNILDPLFNNNTDMYDINFINLPYVEILIGNNVSMSELLSEALYDAISHLSTKRNNDYLLWFKIGALLCKFGKYGIFLWKEFSKLYHNYDEIEIDGKIHSLSLIKGIKIESLFLWLSEDNPEYYVAYCEKHKIFINSLNIKKKEDNRIEFKDILNNGDKYVAQYFYDNFKDKIKTTDKKIYMWNDTTTLWELITRNMFLLHIADFIQKEIMNEKEKAVMNGDDTKIVIYSSLIRKYVRANFCENVLKFALPLFYDDNVKMIMDSCKHEINFKNGIVNLKTGNFRKRTIYDYVTKCLGFNYTLQIDEKVRDDIMKILLNISNDDQVLLNFNLGWLGYCLTGETREQKALLIIGYSASNGKSTMLKMFSKSLPIYSAKLHKNTFCENYTKAHKQFDLIRQPVRMCYIEEMTQEKLDIDSLKDFIDGDKIGGNEILFGTAEDIFLSCKLTITSNKDPIFNTDAGFKRRGLLEILKNRFLEREDYNKNKGEGIYLRDSALESKFDNDVYKLTFVQILLTFAKKYYENGLNIPNIVKNEFADLCDDNDTLLTFINEMFDITNNKDDYISKDDFVFYYDNYYGINIKWKSLMSDVKRLLTYDRGKRVKDGQRGAIIGIKVKDDYKENDDNGDNIFNDLDG